jgi:hypothetical protein
VTSRSTRSALAGAPASATVVIGRKRPWWAGHPAPLAHQVTGPALGLSCSPLAHEGGVDAPVALGPMGHVDMVGDMHCHVLPSVCSRRPRPCLPCVESGSGHSQPVAHRHDRG